MIRISEIFHSLQGESTLVGLPTVFVRLTGCPLRCQYCDTAYAFSGGVKTSIDEVVQKAQSYNAKHVCVTGGEPLAQPGCFELMTRLCDGGQIVSLETSGYLDISQVDPRVIRILDIKTPASGEEHRNLWSNLSVLTSSDQVKFVICDRADYDYAKSKIDEYKLNNICEILFSPSYHEVQPADLAAWILEDQLHVRMQVQLHKVIWGEKEGV